MALSLIVGGVSYTVQESILASYPASFFGRMLKEEWRPAHNEPLVIDRDGALFRHVIDFMTYKCLPRNRKLQCLLDKETLGALLEEADYYQLTELVQEIKELLYYPEKAIIECHDNVKDRAVSCFWTCAESSTKEEVTFKAVLDSDVVDALQPFYAPSCVRGGFFRYYPQTLYKSSTTDTLNIEELLADATPSHFGRNSETVFDRSVRNSLEIKAELLNAETLQSIANCFQLEKMSHTMNLEARPYKLVIYPEGGHFAPHRDTVRGDNHVGTAVYILKSKFTGGEFLVHSGGEAMMVNKPGQWIAMFGDCMHEIRPVLSGVRVTLVYDIYCTGQRSLKEEDEEEREEDEEKNDDDDDDDDDDSFEGEQDDDDDDDDDDEGRKEYEEYFETASFSALRVGREIEKRDKEALIAACRKVDSPFCITLQHLYPKSQSTMHFLKGGDRILFETLSEHHFDVQLVPILHCNRKYYEEGGGRCYEKDEGFAIFDGYDGQKRQRSVHAKNMPLPLFTPVRKLCEKHLIYHQSAIDYTGNESMPEERAYLMRGLFVIPNREYREL